MSWATRFRLRQSLKGSLWVVPLAGGLAGFVLSFLVVQVERVVEVPVGWHYSPGAALTVLTTVIGATVGLTGFVVTVSVLVVQMSTGTFSARYMRLWYRDAVLKATLGVLLATFMFSYALLRRIGTSVPDLAVSMAGLLLGVGIVLFLVFLDRVVHRLRPVKVASLVAASGRRSLRAVVSAVTTGRGTSAQAEALLASGDAALVVRSGRAGSIQAVDAQGLVEWAAAHDSALVLQHAIGDFVSTGTRLLEVRAPHAVDPAEEQRLRAMFALGAERTIDQDPAFALRIMVDVAIRALSPAVNDPTTAVQVIDHLEDLLGAIGTTSGLDGQWALEDDAGRLRVLIPAHRWEDFLSLGVTEIREYGATAVQVVRRLRAMLDSLEETVRPEYTAAVGAERARLDATAAAGFGDTVDRDLAGIADRQGLGGPAAAAP